MSIFDEEKKNILSFNVSNMSKTNLNEIGLAVINNVMEGNYDALHEYIKAKALSEVSAIIINGLKEEAILEAAKYGDGESVLGCKAQVKTSPTTFSFSDDEEWNLINEKIDALVKIRKDRESKMIDAIKYAEIVDENGEVVPPAKIVKSGGTTLAITLPK